MARNIGIHLRSARKAMALTEADLGALIGYSENFVGKCERGLRVPPAAFVIGCLIAFGHSLPELFPVFYDAVEDTVGANAAKFEAQLRDKDDPASRKKIELLNGIATRARREL